MLVKNLIFYQNLNRSLKYWAKSPFKMYKKRIQRPDFTKLSSVILLSELPFAGKPKHPEAAVCTVRNKVPSHQHLYLS